MEKPSLSVILRTVAIRFAFTPAEITSDKRVASLVLPRHVAMYLMRELTDASLHQVARVMGGRDHTTVLQACRKMKERIETDANVRALVTALSAQLLQQEPDSNCVECAILRAECRALQAERDALKAELKAIHLKAEVQRLRGGVAARD